MRPRVQSPEPRVEYFLDCAVQAGELDACSGMTLRLYDRDADVLRITDAEPECKWRRRAQKQLDLCALADEVLADLPPLRRAGLVRSGLIHMADELHSFAEVFSNWAIDDAVEGGDLEPFRDRLRSKNGVPFKRTMRRLRAPRFIRKYVKQHVAEAAHFRALSDVAVRRAREITPANDPTIIQDWRMQIGRKQAVEARRHHRDVRGERKVILRSYHAAASVLGAEAVGAFLRGEEIALHGKDVALVLRKKGALAARGHGCLSVGLATRDGTRLADLCTFIEDTPMLDQLCGFALWMQAGEERKVIETANIIEATPDGKAHPLLLEKPRRSLEAMLADVDPQTADAITRVLGENRKPFRRQLSYEETRARNTAYWEQTKGQWIEAMLANVVGYRNFAIFRAAGAL